MSVNTYFLGQVEIPEVYVPVANLVHSQDGCGTFRYSISGDTNGIFHIKDNTLFIKEVPPVGFHSVDVYLNDPLKRFASISNTFSITVASHYCAAEYFS